MQTFLPYPDFKKSAECLDNKRLWKQILECNSILISLYSGLTIGWKHHPATKMWENYEPALCHYMNEIIDEWNKRGFKDYSKWKNELPDNIVNPPWLGNDEFHSSHRSKLFYKDMSFYYKYEWEEMILPEKDYVWPKL